MPLICYILIKWDIKMSSNNPLREILIGQILCLSMCNFIIQFQINYALHMTVKWNSLKRLDSYNKTLILQL